MGNRKFKILAILLLTPIALIALLWFLIVKPFAENQLNAAIRTSNLPISGDPLKLFFFGIESPSTLTINTRPLPLPLDQPVLRLSPLSIFRLNPKLNLNSSIFGGQLEASLSYRISDGNIASAFKVDDLQIAKYQMASMLGFTEGNINVSFEGQGNSSTQFIPTKFYLMLKGLKKPKASKLPPYISPVPFNIPAIDSGDLLAEVSCSSVECKSNKFSISSNLGQAAGNFSLPLAADGQLQGALTVSLTQSGRTELLPYFSLFNQEIMRTPEKPFMVKLTGQTSKPKLSVVPIRDSM